MKLSKKWKKKIKKRLLVVISSISVILMLFALNKMTEFSASIEQILGSENLLGISEDSENSIMVASNDSSSNSSRLSNTDTVTYIYDAADLVTLRDAVNAGDNYENKTVYLMDDIDLGTICSATVGSWIPIGTTTTKFAGTFEGNYHTIDNLYINSSVANQGLFLSMSGKINNLKLSNAYVKSTGGANGILTGVNSGTIYGVQIESGNIYGDTGTGGIIGSNTGTVILCSNKANVTYTTGTSSSIGGIIGSSSGGTISQCINLGSIQGNHPVGGIIGSGSNCTITQCVNANTVKTVYNSGTNNHGIAGGIVGMTSGKITIDSCYNKGTVTGSATTCQATGGIIGHVSSGTLSGSSVKNCYNIGTISTSGSKGGIIAGYHQSGKITCTANYWLSGCGATYGISQNTTNTGAATITATNLKTYTVTLGSSYAYDVYAINSGYPVLAWQNETTVMTLNEYQAYIGVGEQLQLNVEKSEELTNIIGDNYSSSNFKWTSTNNDVATVNENGMITGISDGYTTIYAYHEASGLYAMCIVNVVKGVANPQIETGNGFTVILKADGSVYTIGNNTKGTIGNGTTESIKVVTEVHIDEDTALSNISKIACRNRSRDGTNKRWKGICMG